jgi:hypothetical protein
MGTYEGVKMHEPRQTLRSCPICGHAMINGHSFISKCKCKKHDYADRIQELEMEVAMAKEELAYAFEELRKHEHREFLGDMDEFELMKLAQHVRTKKQKEGV